MLLDRHLFNIALRIDNEEDAGNIGTILPKMVDKNHFEL